MSESSTFNSRKVLFEPQIKEIWLFITEKMSLRIWVTRGAQGGDIAHPLNVAWPDEGSQGNEQFPDSRECILHPNNLHVLMLPAEPFFSQEKKPRKDTRGAANMGGRRI